MNKLQHIIEYALSTEKRFIILHFFEYDTNQEVLKTVVNLYQHEYERRHGITNDFKIESRESRSAYLTTHLSIDKYQKASLKISTKRNNQGYCSVKFGRYRPDLVIQIDSDNVDKSKPYRQTIINRFTDNPIDLPDFFIIHENDILSSK